MTNKATKTKAAPLPGAPIRWTTATAKIYVGSASGNPTRDLEDTNWEQRPFQALLHRVVAVVYDCSPAGLWTVEFEPRHAELARANLAAAGLADRVTVVVGAGTDALPGLEPHGPFDAVFLDADKANYDRYARWAIANLRPGGLVLGDNAYLFGELLDDDERARGMRAFHEIVAAACDSVCIPTPDGLVLGIKR